MHPNLALQYWWWLTCLRMLLNWLVPLEASLPAVLRTTCDMISHALFLCQSPSIPPLPLPSLSHTLIQATASDFAQTTKMQCKQSCQSTAFWWIQWWPLDHFMTLRLSKSSMMEWRWIRKVDVFELHLFHIAFHLVTKHVNLLVKLFAFSPQQLLQHFSTCFGYCDGMVVILIVIIRWRWWVVDGMWAMVMMVPMRVPDNDGDDMFDGL